MSKLLLKIMEARLYWGQSDVRNIALLIAARLMLRKIPILLLFSSGLIAKGNESINRGYIEAGRETARSIESERIRLTLRHQRKLSVVRNGVLSPSSETRFEKVGPKETFYYSKAADKDAAVKEHSDRLEYLNSLSRARWQKPRINVLGADLVEGMVGMIDQRSKNTSIVDPPTTPKATVSKFNEEGFLGEVDFRKNKVVYFQGFDKAEIKVGAIVELTGVFVVLGLTETPWGQYMTIRKFSDDELIAAETYLEKSLYLREWTDVSGKFKIKAELLNDQSDEDARFYKNDGSQIIIPISKLSEADQQWIKDNVRPSEQIKCWGAR